MSQEARRSRRVLMIAVFAAGAAAAWLWLGREPVAPEPAAPPVAEVETPVAPPPPGDEPEPEAEVRPPLLPPDHDAEAPPAFASIDLEAARAALPDNLYWETAAPTQDPRLLGDRERAKAYWNEQYGKMLSGTGTEEEIKAYFDRRLHQSSDYVRFVDYVLEHQGSELSEQDLKLLHLAKRLHLARLQEVPRKMQEAFDRKAEQDAAREAWLAEQRELEAAGVDEAEGQPDAE